MAFEKLRELLEFVPEDKREELEKLIEDAELYRVAAERNPDIFCAFNSTNLQIIGINRYVKEITGHSREEIIGRPITDFLTPESCKNALATLSEEIPKIMDKNANPRKLELEIITTKGTMPVDVNTSSHIFSDGTPVVLAYMRDISEIKKAQEALRESEERYRIFGENSPVLTWRLCLENLRIMDVIGPSVEILGYTHEELKQRVITDLLTSKSIARVAHAYQSVREAIAKKEKFRTITVEVEQKRKGGGAIDTQVDINLRYDQNGNPAEIVGTTFDVGRFLKKIRYDALTGVYTRSYFFECLEDLRAVADRKLRSEKEGVAYIFMDLNYFKELNDRHGHLAGDRFLAGVGEILLKTCRETEPVGRTGGEEFGIAGEVKSRSAVRIMSERIFSNVNDALVAIGDGASLPVSISMGVAVYPYDARTTEGLYEKADNMMYRSKTHFRETKGNIIHYASEKEFE